MPCEDLNSPIETENTKRKSKTSEPDIASVDMAEVEAALARVQVQLGPSDFELFRRLVHTLTTVTAILNSQRAMLARLRRLFGLSSSEKSRNVLGKRRRNVEADAKNDAPPGADEASRPDGAPGTGATPSEQPQGYPFTPRFFSAERGSTAGSYRDLSDA